MNSIARPPAYCAKARLAAELDIGESTVDEMVRRGVLPKPVRLSPYCVRWRWEDVENALASLREAGNTAPADPYAAGASNVTKIPESRRGSTQGRT